MNAIVRMLARRCENCPLCRYARRHRENWFSKLMILHGKFCPFWRAWERVYGPQPKDELPPA